MAYYGGWTKTYRRVVSPGMFHGEEFEVVVRDMVDNVSLGIQPLTILFLSVRILLCHQRLIVLI